MPNIFLQPSSTNATLKNSDDAILKEISIDQYKDLMDRKDYEILKGIYPDGIAKLRGITPGKNDSEPPRDCRRPNILREYDNENTTLYS